MKLLVVCMLLSSALTLWNGWRISCRQPRRIIMPNGREYLRYYENTWLYVGVGFFGTLTILLVLLANNLL